MPIVGVSLQAWKPPIRGIREVLHARFTDHAYPRHTHDVWTLFIVDDGAIRYDDCFQCLDCVGIYHDPARCVPVRLMRTKGRRIG